MKVYKFGSLVIALAALATAASATVFFDQLGTGGSAETGQNAYASQRFAASDGSGTYQALYSDVAVDDFTTTQTWHLTNVSFGLEFFNNANATSAGITGYEVKIYSAAAGVAANEPLTGDVMDGVLGTGAASVGSAGFAGAAQGYLVSLDLTSLNFNLSAGSYWIGVAVQNSFDTNGQTGILGSTLSDPNSTAANARQINPGGGFALANNNAPIAGGVNLSYQLSGSPVPEPASIAAVGLGVAALLRRRRKA